MMSGSKTKADHLCKWQIDWDLGPADNGLISDVTRRYVGLWEYVEAGRPAGNSGIVDEILACSSQRKAVQGDEALIAEQRQFR